MRQRQFGFACLLTMSCVYAAQRRARQHRAGPVPYIVPSRPPIGAGTPWPVSWPSPIAPTARSGAARITPVRRLLLMALMCLVLGGLGGVLAATATRPTPVAARFMPPREPAFDFALRDQDGRPARLADARGR